MALKFLNKKGWHTGSLRNIENVWKAEQKHDAEQKKLEELRKQIHEERERSEFRALQEQAGLVPRQERLEFLYDSGLAVGRGGTSSEGGGVSFKALEEEKPDKPSTLAPGALFEEKEKPQSANDAWRKLHSDPLLLIRQREQDALARLKNNPVQMALIRKSVVENEGKDKDREKKGKEKDRGRKEDWKKHHHSSSKHHKHSSSKHHSESEDDTAERDKRRKSSNHKGSSYEKRYGKTQPESEYELKREESRRNNLHKEKYRDHSPNVHSEQKTAKSYGQDASKRYNDKSKHEKYSSEGRSFVADKKERSNGSSYDFKATTLQHESQHKQRNVAPKLSEEERAARLREMQMDAELHEEQRWKRLKKAEEDDAREAKRANMSGGRNFLDAAQKSVYGAEKGGSSTIEESVRRRTHYLQGRSEAEGNAFRR